MATTTNYPVSFMLLSVPLTMMVKFAAQGNPQTEWITVLLSPAPEATDT